MTARYLVGRVGQAVLVLWAAYTLSFLLLNALPGDGILIKFENPELGLSADQVAMIKSECDQVGFNVIDSASADFSDRFFTGAGEPWEVALFAWAGSGQIASGRNIYSTDAPQNGGGFSNETVDEAFNTLAGTVDPEVHDEQRAILERALWENLHGIPLFAHPGIVGYDASIQNVRATATQTQVVWNAEQWVRSE